MGKNVNRLRFPTSSPPVLGPSIVCINCGAENREDAFYCWCCGFNHRQGTQPNQKSAPTHIVMGILTGAIGIGVMMALAIALPILLTIAAIIDLFRTCISMGPGG